MGLYWRKPDSLNAKYCIQVAVGRREFLSVFGGDYDTADGTGVRDFIHVVDLAIGHVKAVERITDKCGCVVYNLGTGIGYSVLDMVRAMEQASGKTIAYKIVVCVSVLRPLSLPPSLSLSLCISLFLSLPLSLAFFSLSSLNLSLSRR